MPGRIIPEPPQPDRDPEHLANSASWRAAPASPAWPCSAPPTSAACSAGRSPTATLSTSSTTSPAPSKAGGIRTAFGTGDTDLLAELTGRQWTAIERLDDVMRLWHQQHPTPRRSEHVTTTTTPTPWPTSDQVITALGTIQDRADLHPNWRSVLGRLRQDAERHTALRAARELLHRERQTLAGETDADRPRPSGALAVFDAAAKVGELETMALCRYACCAQAALELVATGAAPASWSDPLPGERPRVDGDEQPLPPEPGEGLGDLRVPEALTDAPGVDLCAAVGQAQARWYRRHRQSPAPKRERVPAAQPPPPPPLQRSPRPPVARRAARRRAGLVPARPRPGTATARR